MSTLAMAWTALSIYIIITIALTYRGWRKTKSLESFAVGSGDISPFIVGLSLAVQLTSVATFVVNPGLVFAYGLSGLMGLGVAAGSGIVLGLVVFSSAFRKMGARISALSVPQWIGQRFKSKSMSLAFGFLSLALITYAVLIIVAISHVLHSLVGIEPSFIALAIIIFVFGYVMLGGANTSAYTNSIQAFIMIIVALLLVGTGVSSFWEGDGLFSKLGEIDSALVSITNPKSLYFRNLFEVFFCNFLVGLALVCQPHILAKTLYLKKDSQIKVYLATAIAAGVIFLLVMFVGLFARLEIPATVPIDKVIPTYMVTHFSGGLIVLISIGLLCAGVSTLEGILLGLTTIVSTDLYLGIFEGNLLKEKSKEQKALSAFKVGRWSFLVIGIITFLLSRWQISNPTGGSVAIFAQFGVYILTTASVVPLAAGMFFPKARKLSVQLGSLSAVVVFLGIGIFKISFMSNNPGFLAAMGITASWLVFFGLQKILPNKTVSEEK